MSPSPLRGGFHLVARTIHGRAALHLRTRLRTPVRTRLRTPFAHANESYNDRLRACARAVANDQPFGIGQVTVTVRPAGASK